MSELFGPEPEAAQEPGATPGDVVRIKGGVRSTYYVPFPAGLAVDDDDNVFVSAFSVFDADGPRRRAGRRAARAGVAHPL